MFSVQFVLKFPRVWATLWEAENYISNFEHMIIFCLCVCGKHINGPQRCQHPNPGNLWIWLSIRQRGFKVEDISKVANFYLPNWYEIRVIILSYLGGSKSSQWSLKVDVGARRASNRWQHEKASVWSCWWRWRKGHQPRNVGDL